MSATFVAPPPVTTCTHVRTDTGECVECGGWTNPVDWPWVDDWADE